MRRLTALAATLAMATAALILGTSSLQDAVANGETRTISLYQTHTKESLTVTFRRNGAYDREALKKLNWLLRDWRRDEPTEMDPKLFELVWAVHREVGSKEPIHVVSAYRSPQTNSMLRRRSRAVAEHSQHMLGKAMDFYLPDADMAQVRAIGMRLQRGGVGYYPSAYNPFVHLDAGSVRSWPRMTRDQLANLFPDGKTVHLPRDGKPLPGYEVAKAEILANGGTVAGVAYADAGEQTPTSSGRSFWAFLFGGADEEEDAELARPTARPAGSIRTASASSPPGFAERDDARSFFLREQQREQQQRQPVAVAQAPTQAPAPATVEAPAQPAVAVQAQQPADASPAEPAAPVPLPTPRPPELARTVVAADPAAPPTRAPGPLLAWQAGADAVVASVPEPPRRPDATSGVAAAQVGSAAVAFVALEPPRRPSDLPSLSETSVFTSGIERTAQASVLAYAAVTHPTPPARPLSTGRAPVAASLAPVPQAPAVVGAAPVASEKDREELNRLFETVATRVSEPAQQVVAVAKTRQAPVAVQVPQAPAKAVVTQFGSGPDLTTDRFSGPAVRPIATATFKPAL